MGLVTYMLTYLDAVLEYMGLLAYMFAYIDTVFVHIEVLAYMFACRDVFMLTGTSDLHINLSHCLFGIHGIVITNRHIYSC